MKQGLDWFKQYPQRFNDGVQGLGPELIGAYAVILNLIYARGGESKRDDRHLSGILGCSTRKAKTLTDQLFELGKIQIEDGFITNSLAKSEAKDRRKLSETRAKQGRKGGEKSPKSSKNNDLDQAIASHTHQADKNRIDKKINNKNDPLFEVLKKSYPKLDGDLSEARLLLDQFIDEGIDFDLIRWSAEQVSDKLPDRFDTKKYQDAYKYLHGLNRFMRERAFMSNMNAFQLGEAKIKKMFGDRGINY